jgi:hypothetical protein
MKMYELLADPAHWTKGAMARTGPNGIFSVEPDDPAATCWCLDGAVVKCYPPRDRPRIRQRLDRELMKLGVSSSRFFNRRIVYNDVTLYEGRTWPSTPYGQPGTHEAVLNLCKALDI